MRRAFLSVFLAAAMMLGGAVAAIAADNTVRVGVLKFGTVNWELDTMKRHHLDEKNGIDVEIVPFASEDATSVALQAGNVDMIVSDWLWVTRERSKGADFTFVPYSTSVGSLMVPDDSPIHSLADLKGKKIGVAGGPLDKNWLLIQALAKRDAGIDLAAENEIVYGAPPLLSAKAESGELDAVLNFWHYAARLEAKGFRPVISGEEAAQALGTSGPVAAIGYIFHESWAKEHPDLVKGFVQASRETKELLKNSDAEWEKLRPLVRPEDDKTLQVMRDRYREGIPQRSPADEQADAEKLFKLLRQIGGEELVGPGESLAPGTYWSGLTNGS